MLLALVLAASLDPEARVLAFHHDSCLSPKRTSPSFHRAFLEHTTFLMQVKGLSGSLSPIQHLSEPSWCLYHQVKTRVLSADEAQAVVELSFLDKPRARRVPIDFHLAMEDGEWRIAFTLIKGDPEAARNKPKQAPAPRDFELGPAERAAGFYRYYLPRSLDFDMMNRSRSYDVVLPLERYLTRRLLLEVLQLAEPLPWEQHQDPLVCFPIEEVRAPEPKLKVIETRLDGDRRATVVLSHEAPDGRRRRPALTLVKEDVWRIDAVSCP